MDSTVEIERQRIRFDFAWKHFDFHAKQRTTMFQYFSTLVPFMAGGYFFFLKERIPWQHQTEALIVVAGVGATLSLVFFLLDKRNRQLYQISEESLQLFEADFLYNPALSVNGRTFHGIITEERERFGRGCLNVLVKFRFLLTVLYATSFLLFTGLGLYALCLHNKWFGWTLEHPVATTSPTRNEVFCCE